MHVGDLELEMDGWMDDIVTAMDYGDFARKVGQFWGGRIMQVNMMKMI